MESSLQSQSKFAQLGSIVKDNWLSILAFIGVGFSFYLSYRSIRNPTAASIHELIINALERADLSRQSLVVEESLTVQYQGLSMIFNLISRLKDKENSKKDQFRNPFLPPFEEGLYITELQPKHRLLFNKFDFYREHVLVVTKQFEPQQSKLNKDDLRQAVLVSKAFQGLYFYNSGPLAGASQTHKHLQIFPAAAKDLPILRDLLAFTRDRKREKGIITYPKFNFLHGIIAIEYCENVQVKVKKQLAAYELLLEQLVRKLRLVDYNFIGCEDFVLLVPRSKEKAFDLLSVNSVGFMGSVLFRDKALLHDFVRLKRHPTSILEDITYPIGYRAEQA